jgi:hypothetical protein
MRSCRLILLTLLVPLLVRPCPAGETNSPALAGSAEAFTPGTLAYHLSTNAVSRAKGRTGTPSDMRALAGWSWEHYAGTNAARLTTFRWSTNFWLAGVRGLSATCIGYSNGTAGQFLTTLISPRHCLFAYHSGPGGSPIAFLGTNNVLHWRTVLQGARVGNTDTAVGFLNADLPPAVEHVPVLPSDYYLYLPTNGTTYVQGIGMNQEMKLFGQPMHFGSPGQVNWSHLATVPFGLGTNWNVALKWGDSSLPERVLIGNQLVLVTQHYFAVSGPNLAAQIPLINQQMHYLSTNNQAMTDYQLTTVSLASWRKIR